MALPSQKVADLKVAASGVNNHIIDYLDLSRLKSFVQ
jgi:hypothetical protein